MQYLSYLPHYSIRDASRVLEACARIVETSEHSFPAARDDLADRLRSIAWLVGRQAPSDDGDDEEETAEWLATLLRTLASGDDLLDHHARIQQAAPAVVAV